MSSPRKDLSVMNYKDVELTSGKTVRVYAPPVIKILAMLRKKYPAVEKVIVTEDTVAGGSVTVIIEDDPQYLSDVGERNEKINDETDELCLLFALKDEEAPADFDIESHSVILRYMYPMWNPREGKVGCKLDWLEWVLLANMADEARVQKAINSLISVDQEVVESTKESFQREVEG